MSLWRSGGGAGVELAERAEEVRCWQVKRHDVTARTRAQAAMALRAVQAPPSGLVLPVRARRVGGRGPVNVRAEVVKLDSNPLLTARYPTGARPSHDDAASAIT